MKSVIWMSFETLENKSQFKIILNLLIKSLHSNLRTLLVGKRFQFYVYKTFQW